MLTPAMAIFFEAGRIRAGSLRDEARTSLAPARRRRKRRVLRQAVGTRLVNVGLRMLRGVA